MCRISARELRSSIKGNEMSDRKRSRVRGKVENVQLDYDCYFDKYYIADVLRIDRDSRRHRSLERNVLLIHKQNKRA